MADNPTPFWMALAHAGNFSNKRKIDFLINTVLGKETIQTAIQKLKNGDKQGFDFSEKEWLGITEAIADIPNYSFLAEKLSGQGIEMVNILEQFAYPKTLKENLKRDAPVLIYTKGNTDLLKKNSVAIVGSRNCSAKSLEFTDIIAKKAVAENSVIVSGFAKGVDKQALDSALKYKGQSIIVLPQGIETYKSKIYYPDIVRGDVLVISTYHPKMPWSLGLAMDRNKIIYGLADEIYAAESGDSGGTWEGVRNGIKRGRKVFIRFASSDEKNANNLLIRSGAVPVDFTGKIIENYNVSPAYVSEPEIQYQEVEKQNLTDDEILAKVIQKLRSLKGKGLTANDIIRFLHLETKDTSRITGLLTADPGLIMARKGRANIFLLKEFQAQQTDIFGETQ